MKSITPYAEVQNVRSLEQCEAVIEKGLQTYIEVGTALREIRDGRLYRKNYSTFEEYCRTRWGWGRQKVDRDIEAAEFVTRQIESGETQNFTKTQALTAAREERRELAAKQEALDSRLQELGGAVEPYTPPPPAPRKTSTLADILFPPEKTALSFVQIITKEEMQLAYRAAAKRLHPDRNGDAEKMAELNRLWANLELTIYKGEQQ